MSKSVKSMVRNTIFRQIIRNLYYRLFTLIRGRITEEQLSNIFTNYVVGPPENWMNEFVRRAFFRDFVGYVRDWDSQIFKELDDPFVNWPGIDQYGPEFEDFASKQTFEPGGMINSALIVVYSLIRHSKPQIFIESGTKNGCSSVVIAEALRQNDNNPKFYCLSLLAPIEKQTLEKKLAPYSFVDIIEGYSEENIDSVAENVGDGAIAILVDGPKAGSPAWDILTDKIQRYFSGLQFICFDGCQEHLPYFSLENSHYLERRGINIERPKLTKLWQNHFLKRGFSLTCQSNQFCKKYGYLNEKIYSYRNDRWGSDFPWRPFHVDRIVGHVAHSYKLGTIYRPEILQPQN